MSANATRTGRSLLVAKHLMAIGTQNTTAGRVGLGEEGRNSRQDPGGRLAQLRPRPSSFGKPDS